MATPRPTIRPVMIAALVLFSSVTIAGAQGRRAHLSQDLQRHLGSGDTTSSTVIVTGTSAQIAAIAERHGLRIRRQLASGAVLEIPAGQLDEVAADADVPQLSGDNA